MNVSLLFMLSIFFKARAETLPGEAKQWKFWVCQLWLLRQKLPILKMTFPQKNGHRIKTPSSKLVILVSSCWKKFFLRINVHHYFIQSLVFLKLVIVGVAFFLGHPVFCNYLLFFSPPPPPPLFLLLSLSLCEVLYRSMSHLLIYFYIMNKNIKYIVSCCNGFTVAWH